MVNSMFKSIRNRIRTFFARTSPSSSKRSSPTSKHNRLDENKESCEISPETKTKGFLFRSKTNSLKKSAYDSSSLSKCCRSANSDESFKDDDTLGLIHDVSLDSGHGDNERGNGIITPSVVTLTQAVPMVIKQPNESKSDSCPSTNHTPVSSIARPSEGHADAVSQNNSSDSKLNTEVIGKTATDADLCEEENRKLSKKKTKLKKHKIVGSIIRSTNNHRFSHVKSIVKPQLNTAVSVSVANKDTSKHTPEKYPFMCASCSVSDRIGHSRLRSTYIKLKKANKSKAILIKTSSVTWVNDGKTTFTEYNNTTPQNGTDKIIHLQHVSGPTPHVISDARHGNCEVVEVQSISRDTANAKLNWTVPLNNEFIYDPVDKVTYHVTKQPSRNDPMTHAIGRSNGQESPSVTRNKCDENNNEVRVDVSFKETVNVLTDLNGEPRTSCKLILNTQYKPERRSYDHMSDCQTDAQLQSTDVGQLEVKRVTDEHHERTTPIANSLDASFENQAETSMISECNDEKSELVDENRECGDGDSNATQLRRSYKRNNRLLHTAYESENLVPYELPAAFDIEGSVRCDDHIETGKKCGRGKIHYTTPRHKVKKRGVANQHLMNSTKDDDAQRDLRVAAAHKNWTTHESPRFDPSSMPPFTQSNYCDPSYSPKARTTPFPEEQESPSKLPFVTDMEQSDVRHVSFIPIKVFYGKKNDEMDITPIHKNEHNKAKRIRKPQQTVIRLS